MTNRKMTVILVVPFVLLTLSSLSTAWAGSPTIADLIYDPATGSVWVNTSQAAGGVVTSFQFENNPGTFIPGNYVGPTGGTFGGFFENVTTKVIGDSDLTFAGFSGIHAFGQIFPSGMSQTQLESYLTTAVYTGSLGSGQQTIDIQVLAGGDANLDGVVDATDYVIMKSHMGQATGAGSADGDFDSSGAVDWTDLQIFILAISTGAQAQAVPEPATLALLAFGGFAALRRRRS